MAGRKFSVTEAAVKTLRKQKVHKEKISQISAENHTRRTYHICKNMKQGQPDNKEI